MASALLVCGAAAVVHVSRRDGSGVDSSSSARTVDVEVDTQPRVSASLTVPLASAREAKSPRTRVRDDASTIGASVRADASESDSAGTTDLESDSDSDDGDSDRVHSVLLNETFAVLTRAPDRLQQQFVCLVTGGDFDAAAVPVCHYHNEATCPTAY